MGLLELARTIPDIVFSAIGDTEEVTFHRNYENTTYDTATGVVTEDPDSSTNVRAVFCQYADISRLNEAIGPNDVKVYFDADELGFEPKEGDEFVRELDSVRWRVLSIKTDPARAAYVCQCRRP